MYVHIYRERERKRERYIYIYIERERENLQTKNTQDTNWTLPFQPSAHGEIR